eukprot:CAMPEP_0196807144 /NCGR_PEP_ID=MMETSP1362-20130617/7101_1 /TAXON_ID=163516 /ORGANISM="Leptocylindrus danicus, Strain CCMP1856" /LENGTH=49 /DNA_ID= /DNA_START= /DNA_END= /DNA_ORIENTATION=
MNDSNGDGVMTKLDRSSSSNNNSKCLAAWNGQCKISKDEPEHEGNNFEE